MLVHQGLSASAPAACSRASPRCSRRPAAITARATAYDLGFVVGPRLNAAGRLTDMSLGIECLATDDSGRAAAIARGARPPQPRAPRDRGRTCRRTRWRRSDAMAAEERLQPHPLRPRLAPGRGRHRRLAHEGPRFTARPSRSRAATTARSRAPAARSPGCTCATRSTSWPMRHPGSDTQVRRPRRGGGPDAARARFRPLSRGVRGNGAHARSRRRPASASLRPTARSTPDVLQRSKRRAVLGDSSLGPGISRRRASATSSRSRRSAWSATSISSSRSKRGALAVRGDPLSATRTRCRRGSRRSIAPVVNEYRRHASLQLTIEHWEPATLMRH